MTGAGQLNMAEIQTVVEDTVDGIDYSKMTADELVAMIVKTSTTKPLDTKLIGQLSRLHGKAEAAEQKDAKDTLLAALSETTTKLRKRIKKVIDEMKASGELNGAEGVWVAYDFGEIEEPGINPSCRLIKSSRGKAAGGATSTSSYVSNPTPSKELLAQVGTNVYFANDEEVTIDKVKHTMAAGTTYQEAHDFSTNGGWRNRVRMALLKEAKLV